MNPSDELQKLMAPFPGSDQLFQRVEHVPASVVPEPFRSLLVHDQHMTVTLENRYRSPVQVQLLSQTLAGNIHCRKIRLVKGGTNHGVLFGLVRFDLQFVTPMVRDELLAGQTPLGRILINHNVLRQVDLGAVLEIVAGPELATHLPMQQGDTTYGRLATIFCNRRPAVDLLEVATPLDYN